MLFGLKELIMVRMEVAIACKEELEKGKKFAKILATQSLKKFRER